MPIITRNRTIRPSTRLETSKSYKIDTRSVTGGDTLVVNITHESKPFNKSFTFLGSSVKDKDSISFRVTDYGTHIDISWSGAQPNLVPMKYEHRIVAYIDILGFSEMIKQTVNENKPELAQKQLDAIHSVVTSIRTYVNSAKNKVLLGGHCQITMFSDTIVFSIPKAESARVLAMFRVLKRLQISMLTKNILMRGSVVHGELIHTDEVILGPALINAYNVESKSAVYPRFVIDPHVTYLYLRKNGVTIQKNRIKDFVNDFVFTDDFDGTYYIDYFNEVQDYLSDNDVVAYYNKVAAIIKLGKVSKDTGIRMKYLWMDQKLKEAIALELEVRKKIKDESSI